MHALVTVPWFRVTSSLSMVAPVYVANRKSPMPGKFRQQRNPRNRCNSSWKDQSSFRPVVHVKMHA